MGAQTAQPYPYGTHPTTTTSRYPASHANSSAFSASAHPNEDWTKISDLAERRRIQNRIAQRNYRKKLKKRLEDLERKAASTSTSPEPEANRSTQMSPKKRSQQLRNAFVTSPQQPRYPRLPDPFYGQPGQPKPLSTPEFERQLPHSPPMLTYSSYDTSDGSLSSQYPHSPALSSYSLPSSNDQSSYGTYLSPRVSADFQRHSLHDPVAIKQEYLGEDYSTYGFGYDPNTGMDFSNSSYRDAYTPPLSDAAFDSFDNSVIHSPQDLWDLFPTPPPESPRFYDL